MSHNPGAGRMLWPDLAKSICIVLVVLWHTTMKAFPEVGSQSAVDAWTVVNEALLPIRMPLFFVISGFLFTRAMDRGWGAVLKRKVAPNYYLYAVWVTVGVALFSFLPPITNRTNSPLDYITELALGYATPWYLYALAVYAVATRLLRGSPRLALLLFASIAVAATVLPAGVPGNMESILRNLVFFAAGAYLPHVVLSIANGRRAVYAVTGGAAYLAGVVAFHDYDLVGTPMLSLALSCAAVVFGIAGASLLASTRVGLALSGLGHRTLPIYVLHTPILAALTIPTLQLTGAWAYFYPVVMTALVVALSIAAYAALNRVAPWLFRLPTWASRSRLMQVETVPAKV